VLDHHGEAIPISPTLTCRYPCISEEVQGRNREGHKGITGYGTYQAQFYSFLFISCTSKEERWNYEDVHRLQGTKQEDLQKLIPHTQD
jgi:hypothetical protein